jgi:hypothetical protein
VVRSAKDVTKTDERFILTIAAEGGSLRIVRIAHSDAPAVFVVRRNESALADLLDDEEFSRPSAVSESPAHASFETALAALDQYPWHQLFPVTVHPDYADVIGAAVKARGGEEALTRWQRRLKSNRP